MDAEVLLRLWGFSRNPFQDAAAEKQKNPASFFVMPSVFGEVVGDREEPVSSFVFGDRGDGKTALRLAVKDALAHSENKRLLVDYLDFSCFRKDADVKAASLDVHVENILRLTIDALLTHLEEDPKVLLHIDGESLRQLQLYVLRFSPHGRTVEAEGRWIRILDGVSEDKKWKKIGGKGFRRLRSFLRRKRLEIAGVDDQEESNIIGTAKIIFALLTPSIAGVEELGRKDRLSVLAKLIGLMKSVKLSGLVVVVDSLDETALLVNQPALMAELVNPMAQSLGLLEMNDVAVKFFLPAAVRSYLHDLREDRILVKNLSWSDAALAKLLEKRLLAFSDGRIACLDRFIENEMRDVFMRSLGFYSAGNPRNMLRLISRIISVACYQSDDASIVSGLAMEEGVRQFVRDRLSESDGSSYEAKLRKREGEEPPFGLI